MAKLRLTLSAKTFADSFGRHSGSSWTFGRRTCATLELLSLDREYWKDSDCKELEAIPSSCFSLSVCARLWLSLRDDPAFPIAVLTRPRLSLRDDPFTLRLL